MKNLTLFLFFTALSPLFSNGQETIQGNEQDRVKLEQLVKEKIDSVRVKHKRSVLTMDPILYKAAKQHSLYIKKTGKLSHIETGDKSMKSPQDRVNHFGATNLLAGENILWTDYNINITSNRGKKFNGKSLNDLANAIVTLWIESPDHYKNMLTKEYTLTGISVEFDSKVNRVYVTQVFAYFWDE